MKIQPLKFLVKRISKYLSHHHLQTDILYFDSLIYLDERSLNKTIFSTPIICNYPFYVSIEDYKGEKTQIILNKIFAIIIIEQKDVSDNNVFMEVSKRLGEMPSDYIMI